MEDKILTIQEVAKKLSMSDSWVYRKCQAGIMPHIRIGSVIRIQEKNLQDRQTKRKEVNPINPLTEKVGKVEKKEGLMEDKLLTPRQVAYKLQVSESWVYKKCAAKIIPHVKIGGVVRIREKALDKWILDHETQGRLKL